MKWMKQIDAENEVVTFSVIQGYRMRNRLKKYGFRWVSAGKKWVCTVPLKDAARIKQIEEDLRGSESKNFGPIGPQVFRG